MIRVMVIDDRDSVAELIVKRLSECHVIEFCQRATQQEDGFGGHLSGGYFGLLEEHVINAAVYSPRLRGHRIDLKDAEHVFRQCARAGVEKFVLLSSAMIYGASPHNQGLMPETRTVLKGECGPFASDWRKLEAMALSCLGQASRAAAQLTILRLAAMLAPDGNDYF